ncbi:MAG: hypothetical protein DRO88_08050 [Promethearchaeia archaeon]|nr:MAG: hypothetical protein DRO88_08050 [Candidatus Lokiarchaeia archaeon]
MEFIKLASQLKNDEKYKEAIEYLNNIGRIPDLPYPTQIRFFQLQGELYYHLNDYSKALNAVEDIFRLYLITNDEFARLEGIILKAKILLDLGKYEECRNTLMMSEEILNILKVIPEQDMGKKKQEIAHLWAIYFWEIGVYSKLFEYAKQNLVLSQKYGDTHTISRSYLIMGLGYGENGHLDQAIVHYQKCVDLARHLNEPQKSRVLSAAYNNIGENYRLKGELDRSLVYYQKSFALDKKTNALASQATVLHNLGLVYAEKGEKEESLKSFLKALKIEQDLENRFEMVRTFFDILVNHHNFLSEAEKERYLQEIKKIRDNENYRSPAIEFRYLIARALVMKSSGIQRQIIKAEEILSQLVDNPALGNELLILALLHLCEILFQELQLSSDASLLAEISKIIDKLHQVAEKEHSFSLLAETSLFKAKLKLLNLKLMQAQTLFTQAQQLALSYNLTRVAKQISLEHDKLLQNLEIWKQVAGDQAPLSQRLQLISLKEDLEVMLRKRPLDLASFEIETPLLLSIITEAGSPLFSYYFSEKWQNSSLFSSFLTAFNTFSREFFDNTIDRVKIGKNTILMKPFQNLFICYVIKGPTYPAQEKLTLFIEHIRNSASIQRIFADALKRNIVLSINEIPILKGIIESDFLKKPIVLT